MISVDVVPAEKLILKIYGNLMMVDNIFVVMEENLVLVLRLVKNLAWTAAFESILPPKIDAGLRIQ